MNSAEQLFVLAMLTWTMAAQVALWRLTRRGEPAPVPSAVPVIGRRPAGGRSE
jgi:hypothetical protein